MKKETSKRQEEKQENQQNVEGQRQGGEGKLGIFNVFLGISGGNSNKNANHNTSNPQGAPVMDDATPKQRKAPIKIEPKVFFSNERTFLAWMHISVILAGASIFIMALAPVDDGSGGTRIPEKQLYGIITLPVAVAFIIYSMYHCKYCTPYSLLLDILISFASKFYLLSFVK